MMPSSEDIMLPSEASFFPQKHQNQPFSEGVKQLKHHVAISLGVQRRVTLGECNWMA